MRNGRPSLTFAPISRTLPNDQSIIRVGRYSEREGVPPANPTVPSDAPVGFKSKVVSRKHCEFSFLDGQWQIKDVASSSGTFLNHIRLSQPNTESRLFPIKDGDIVQLGIDFRGGEEMIFRCVKIRIECNRAWQKKPNNFKFVLAEEVDAKADQRPVKADINNCRVSPKTNPRPTQTAMNAPFVLDRCL
jgi:pSer/pThr/pTyr-binding forkhead associated (FHA) protein